MTPCRRQARSCLPGLGASGCRSPRTLNEESEMAHDRHHSARARMDERYRQLLALRREGVHRPLPVSRNCNQLQQLKLVGDPQTLNPDSPNGLPV